jgi:hypothetical protein
VPAARKTARRSGREGKTEPPRKTCGKKPGAKKSIARKPAAKKPAAKKT